MSAHGAELSLVSLAPESRPDDENPGSNRVLTVPNWSLGRERTVVRRMADLLEDSPVDVHYCESDVDHNRTVTAFSGPVTSVLGALDGLCQLAMPTVNLQRHAGVHPRIGALDVLPFVALPGGLPEPELILLSEGVGSWLATTYDVPVFLYDKSAHREHADLPHFRKGGFGGMVGRVLDPDFGPKSVHPHMGASVVGVRDFLVALNVNFKGDNLAVCDRVAAAVRGKRRDKAPGFRGVRALAFPLASRGMTQVSLNFTQPDLTQIDSVVEWVVGQAGDLELDYVELIGVVRDRDLPTARCISPRPSQVVPWGRWPSP